jgi:hypothetical protein
MSCREAGDMTFSELIAWGDRASAWLDRQKKRV